MIIEAIATGKTVDEAKEKALKELGSAVENVDVDVEIIDMPRAKTLGIFGGNEAKVRVFAEVEDSEVETKTEEVKIKPLVKSAQMDKKTEKKTVEYLKEILTHMGVENVSVEVKVEEDGTKINFDGDNLGVSIGRKGETIDAIQHLISLVANKGQEEYIRISLNPGEYRQKREQVLVNLAKKSAEKAKKFNKNIMLEAMNSYERRIVHNAVQEVEGVESWSIGENDHRRVCIGTSKDNKIFRPNNRRNNGRRNNYHKGGRRPARQVYKPRTTDRAPKADNDMPLYGVIK